MTQAGLEVGQVALTATDFPSSASKVLRCVTQRLQDTQLSTIGEQRRKGRTHTCVCLCAPETATAGHSQALGGRGIE